MSERINHFEAIDLGTTNIKPCEGDLDNGRISFGQSNWLTNEMGELAVPGAGTFSCWHGDILKHNIGQIKEAMTTDTAETCRLLAISGAQATSFILSDQHGEPFLVAIHEPRLPLTGSEAQVAQLHTLIGAEKPLSEKRTVMRLLALKPHYERLTQTHHFPAWNELIVEPYLSGIARLLAGHQHPWGPTRDDHRGFVNGTSDPQKVADLFPQIMQLAGFEPHQYGSVEEDRSKRLASGKDVFIGGDWTMESLFIRRLIELGLFDKDRGLVSLDSNFKLSYFGEDSAKKEMFDTPNGTCVYTVLSTGAIVNKRIMFRLYEKELEDQTGDPFLYLDNRLRRGMDRIEQGRYRYFFYPDSDVIPNKYGVLVDSETGKTYSDNWESITSDGLEKDMINAAIISGLGFSISMYMEGFNDLAFQGGMVQPGQDNKLKVLVNCQRPGTRCLTLEIPDASQIAALFAYEGKGMEVTNIADLVKQRELDEGGTYANYGDWWLQISKNIR